MTFRRYLASVGRVGLRVGHRIGFRVGLGVGVSALALAGCSSGTPAPDGARPPTTTASAAAATRPVLGAWHHLVYDGRAGAVVLVNGGTEHGHPAGAPLELWSWNGQAWHRLNPVDGQTPGWRNFAAVAYDTDRSVLIVHGGLQGRGQPLDETWEWDGQRWRRFAADGPGGREGAKLAYDSHRRLTVLIGGIGAAGASDATWGWNGSTWRRLATAGPGSRFPGLLEYEPTRRSVVLYGGHPVDGPTQLADTWIWDGRRWREVATTTAPGPKFNVAATFHPKLGRIVTASGADAAGMYGDMWTFDGAAWTKLPDSGLPPRQAAGLAYDATRDRLVLTGGLDQPGTAARLQDVWEWDGTRFAKVLA
jgi:hypothetical protein